MYPILDEPSVAAERPPEATHTNRDLIDSLLVVTVKLSPFEISVTLLSRRIDTPRELTSDSSESLTVLA